MFVCYFPRGRRINFNGLFPVRKVGLEPEKGFFAKVV